nr:hypothetical protein [Pseudomonas sp. NFPP33]
MEEIIDKAIMWFENASGLANFFTIATPIAGIIIAFRKRLFPPKLKKHSISELAENITKRPTPTNVKTIGKIAFVDDEISDFPIAELKKQGIKSAHTNRSVFPT